MRRATALLFFPVSLLLVPEHGVITSGKTAPCSLRPIRPPSKPGVNCMERTVLRRWWPCFQIRTMSERRCFACYAKWPERWFLSGNTTFTAVKDLFNSTHFRVLTFANYFYERRLLRITFRQTTPPFCELSNDKFSVSKTVERAQLILEPSFNIAISNKRVSLFAVLCAVRTSI